VSTEIERADAYELYHDVVIPAWIDESLDAFGVEDENARRFTQSIVLDVVTPRELRRRQEPTMRAVLPFAAGVRSELTIHPRFDGWVLAIPDSLARHHLPSWIQTTIVESRLRSALAALPRGPTDAPIDDRVVASLADRIAPEPWIEAQVVGATYAIARWAVGEERRFELHIDFRERVREAGMALKEVLSRSAVEAMMIERVVLPAVEAGLAHVPLLADRSRVARDAIAEIAPPGFVASQVDAMIDALVEYLVGADGEFRYEVDTEPLRGPAARVLSALVYDAALARLGSLPACGEAAATATAEQQLADHAIPTCLPDAEQDRSIRAYAQVAASERDRTAALVERHFPRVMRWGSTELRAGIGHGAARELGALRSLVQHGFVYTDEDFRRDLGTQIGLGDARIDALRHFLGSGFTYTEVHLSRAHIAPSVERDLILVHRIAKARWFAGAVLWLSIVGLAWIGGRDRGRRATTVLSALAISLVLHWLITGPLLGALSRAAILDVLPDTAAVPARARAGIDALIDRATTVASALEHTFRRWTALSAALVTPLAIAVGWRTHRRRPTATH
jgi:hypothetical protein